MDVMRFLQLCRKLDLAPGDLHNLTWQAKPTHAAWANEGGLEYQLPLLLASFGRWKLEETLEMIAFQKRRRIC